MMLLPHTTAVAHANPWHTYLSCASDRQTDLLSLSCAHDVAQQQKSDDICFQDNTVDQRVQHTYILYLGIYIGLTCTFQLLDKPWSQVSSLLPPGTCLQFYRA